MAYDLNDWIVSIVALVSTHNLGRPGAYRRWNWAAEGKARDLGLNPYGCADAANILYTLAQFPSAPAERAGWIETLRGLQAADSGEFREATHHPIHTTAHCIAALELFEARPSHPLAFLAGLKDPPALVSFLAGLDWAGNPWNESHCGAGVFAALTLAGESSLAWEDAYLNWISSQFDPSSGLLRLGCAPAPGSAHEGAIFPHLAGTFHYLFNLEHARQALPYPRQLVDTCLEIWHRDLFPLGRQVGFAEIDWVYCLSRARRQSGHRFAEAQQALEEFAARYIPYLLGLDVAADEGLNDLHSLFGALCALAELQRELRGQIRTPRPLRLVLDRRPFI
jgi:hypothetical protein